MKKLFPVVLLFITTLSLSAANQYVVPGGKINHAIDAASNGDTVFIATGIYHECISIRDSVHVFGGYSADFSTRDVELYPTVLDGTDMNHYLLVKYDGPCTVETVIDGLTIQNTETASSGGGAYIRQNVVLSNCIITRCISTSSAGGVYNDGGIVRNCIIELCTASSSGGAAINTNGGIIENTIIRGNGGKEGAVRNYAGCIVRNCLFYNNSATEDGWPNSGSLFNYGTAYNNTLVNNWGTQYAGCHSEGLMINNLMWGNVGEDIEPSSGEAPCYISGAGSTKNAADAGFGLSSAYCYTLSSDNNAAKGPHFVKPTSFYGIPRNEGEIAVMRSADWHLTAASPILDKGIQKTGVPTTDLDGVSRPQGTGIDLGCYEFDPNALPVPVQAITLTPSAVSVEEESTTAFGVVFTPKNASNRDVVWTVEDANIATVDANGIITGMSAGTTHVTATSADGSFQATGEVTVTEKPVIIIHPEVLAADTLYPIENYTIPSFIPFWAAKEAARADSSAANLAAMRDAIPTLVEKTKPYCVVANINGDPRYNMAFCWFTNAGVTDGKVEITNPATGEKITLDATATTTKPLRYAVSASGLIKKLNMDKKQAFTYVSHKAKATNLTPGTTYTYRVGYKGNWSERYTFRTADEEQGDFSFVYMSDSHIMNDEYVEHARWCSETVIKNEKDVRFCTFPGDFVETGTVANSEWEWERWFEESLQPVISQMPMAVTDGNHDDTELLNYNWHFNTDNAFNKRSLLVRPQFDGIVYSFVYGDVLFLVYSMQDYWRESGEEELIDKLSSAYLQTDLGNWFREQVAAHPECKYRVTLCHKNIFSGSGHQEDAETPLFRATMLPIFKECEIDLALQGHDHCYEVIGPVNPDTRKVVEGAVSNVTNTAVNANTNMTGLKGGTFCTDEGTLYFIGATCGRKRYYPNSRAEMEELKPVHKVDDYFDLFTSTFGQPGAPSYTRVNVSTNGLELKTYTASSTGTRTEYNTIKVVRTQPHTSPTALPQIPGKSFEASGIYDVLGNAYSHVSRSGLFIIKSNNETRKVYIR
ncbi:MAG: fibronectin type III domain-containing protein [Paludibacteraceae bacterium]|nr:fibronectin type III domain-containing protein [Paludibacteraceae bacterium]